MWPQLKKKVVASMNVKRVSQEKLKEMAALFRPTVERSETELRRTCTFFLRIAARVVQSNLGYSTASLLSCVGPRMM